MTRIVFTILASIFLMAEAHGQDRVTILLLDTFDRRQFRTVTPVSRIQKHGIVRIWCWIKVVSDSPTVVPETYYIELGYNEGNRRKVLSDFNKEDIFKFERPITQIEAYHWFVKRIWTSNKGEYDFTIYTKRDGNMQAVGTTSVIVEDTQ
jgi:hypothetical protein